jgi:HSP20 family molecular chaperone IbpA
MKIMNKKFIAGLSLALVAGIGIGFTMKESADHANAAQASESKVVVQKVPAAEIGKFNHLLSPNLWDVYLDPLWVPVDFTARALPLIPIMSVPIDTPKIQTYDQDNELRIVAQVPGLGEKDVNVQVSDGTLTIKGHKVKEQKDASRFESVDESFQQTVNLPCKVNADKVQATVKDGILTVSLPKARGS